MSHSTIQGIIPPMVTPFDDNEALDLAAVQREATRLLSAGVDGLSFAGSTGEGALLCDDELEAGVRAIRAVVGKSVPLLCGIIRNSTKDAISAAHAAMRGGADCLMVTPTYYHGASTAGNLAYFNAIHKNTGMPIILYNVIQNNPILPDAVPLLEEIPGVIGIKQSVGGVHALVDMIAACQDRLTVFAAQDDLLYLSYIAGAKGAISAILTLFPEECVAQWNAVLRGDLAAARAINDRMLPVWRAIEGKAFPGRLKTALKLMGITVGNARHPILPTEEWAAVSIRCALQQNGFI